MNIDGAKGAPRERVVLDEFFDRPTHVDIRIIAPFGRALLREIMMEGFEVGEMDSRDRTAAVKTNTKGLADREIRVRNAKLQYTFAGTSIMSGGSFAEWNKELWDALDELDPRILEKVVGAIDVHSRLVAGEAETDPT